MQIHVGSVAIPVKAKKFNVTLRSGHVRTWVDIQPASWAGIRQQVLPSYGRA